MARDEIAERQVAAYLRHRVEQWVAAGQSQNALAELAGIAGSRITALKRGEASWKTFQAIGQALGLGFEDLIAEASTWARETKLDLSPPPPKFDLPIVLAGRRALAAALARQDGASDRAIVSVLQEPVQPEDEQLSIVRWAMRMVRRDVEITEGTWPRRATVPPPQSTALPPPAAKRRR